MTDKTTKRLFVDMDGTLAEWRNIVLKVENYEQKDTVLKKLNALLLSPGYFISLEPHRNVVNAIRQLIQEGYEVFILTCVIEKNSEPNPKTEKIDWLSKYVPEINKNHIIFVPDGENKTKYIPGGVQKGDITLDDYSPKLRDFEKAGGVGIKLLNEVNESTGSWRGNTISMSESSEKIAEDLKSILDGKTLKVNHHSPKKNRIPVAEITIDTIIEER